MRCNESGWLPGQARDVANDAAARRVPRSCGSSRAPLTGTADDAPGAAGCSRMHRDASRRNDDAHRATASAASSLRQIQAGHEVPGHRSRTALRQAEGAATPHAAPQAARVHAKCRMMRQMQFCPFEPRSRTRAAWHGDSSGPGLAACRPGPSSAGPPQSTAARLAAGPSAGPAASRGPRPPDTRWSGTRNRHGPSPGSPAGSARHAVRRSRSPTDAWPWPGSCSD